MRALRFLVLAAAGCGAPGAAEFQKADTKVYHLRSGADAEWEDYANRFVDGRNLSAVLESDAVEGEATLYLFQENVKHRWPVVLNGRALGALVQQDEPLVSALPVPAGTREIDASVPVY